MNHRSCAHLCRNPRRESVCRLADLLKGFATYIVVGQTRRKGITGSDSVRDRYAEAFVLDCSVFRNQKAAAGAARHTNEPQTTFAQ